MQQQQRVYVEGGKGEEDKEAVELEVYNQGMMKTELCNKWQETGACPYGHHCQFAHGITELRPVIRHPRYKTELCRMVLAGDTCPYGHRCHFRHTLTDQERSFLLAPPPPWLINITFSNYVLLSTYITHHHHHHHHWSCTMLFWGCTYFSSSFLYCSNKQRVKIRPQLKKWGKKKKNTIEEEEYVC